MLSLDELLAPITPDQFRADYQGRKPLHIPAGPDAEKRRLLPWDAFNRLLGQTAHWTSANLKLQHNGGTLHSWQYCRETRGQAGVTFQAVPGKVQALMAMGASVVANSVETLTPELSALRETLSRAFAAQVGANVYCSFRGVQAFNTHYDLHDVFAIQTEGEKVWRLYASRAENPVAFEEDLEAAEARIMATRGPVLTEVTMRPGDVLYLPRGWYHDALARDGESLHVTWSITPLYGRILFGLLENAAMQDPAFRAWLAPAGEDGGRALADQVADLGQRLARLTALPAFVDEVAMAQERLVPRSPPYVLPARPELTFYAPTGLAAPTVGGPAQVAVDWALGQPRVALEDMIAQFDFIPEPALRAAIARLEAAGALKRQ